ncbi:apolipoprotein N-acyltransferase [Carbonactinospora thermoautotrophica]|uniref:apolipoprotein N-acyltransferase n=1 Tax=Carbonactinospora thermoautotrophica TaxID=1469144 RepID=UPI00226E1BAA|nr:apolipoprotein N-acyltransferase [Carbonactinospora thermoautotrophica]
MGGDPGRAGPGLDVAMTEAVPRTRRARFRAVARAVRSGLAAVGAGAVLAVAFPEVDWGWAAWVGLVPALLVLRRASTAGEAAARGWLVGVGFLTAVQYWLVPALGVFFPLATALLALLWAPWGVLVRWLLAPPLSPGRAGTAIGGVAAGWVLIEAARSWPVLGGPWAALGTSQWRYPPLLGLAAVGGMWLVGFAVVAVNTAVVVLLTGAGPRARAVGLVAALLLLGAGPAWHASQPDSRPVAVRVALVQPGPVVDRAERLAVGERMTRALAAQEPDLVVWGESSVGYDLDRHPDVLARLVETARAVRADLLVNVDAERVTGRIAKVSVLVGPGGIEGEYVKTRLVPFGEYVPLRDQLGWLSRVTRAADQDRQRGSGPRALRAGHLTVAPLTCFESTFPDLARAAARNQAQLIAYQSSTWMFQHTWGPEQQAALGAVRAVETGRPAVQAALTGVSAAFDAHGRRLAWLGTEHRGVLVVDVPLERRDTVYVRLGDLVPLLALLALVVIGTARFRGRRAVSGSRG